MKLLVARGGGQQNSKFDEGQRTPSSVYDFQSHRGLLINRIDTYTIRILDAAIRSSKSLVELRSRPNYVSCPLNYIEHPPLYKSRVTGICACTRACYTQKNLLEDNRGPHLREYEIYFDLSQ